MIRIEKQIDELTFEWWEFTRIDNIIYLDGYSVNRKETKRSKKFKCLKRYSRLIKRDCTITEADVPLSDEIKKEVFDQYISTVKVCKWSEKNNY